MQVIYVGEEFPSSVTLPIFLAGPSPRADHVSSWRPEVLKLAVNYEQTL